jgi:hypothetical protein
MSVTVKDEVTLGEERFFDQALLSTAYFRKWRDGYYKCKDSCFLNPYRNYLTYLKLLAEVGDYNEQHASSFLKRLKSHPDDWRGCESVLSEVIVYHYYIRLVNEGLVKAIRIEKDECDIIVERPDGTAMFLEVFCIMPQLDPPAGPRFEAQEIKTHTQAALSSVRQKLLMKISKQKQLSQPRENYAVIELNHPLIAYDFTVLSSLSDGYKVHVNLNSNSVVGEGYDWERTVFDLPELSMLRGVIWFHLGAYLYRKMLLNPNCRVIGKSFPPVLQP